jgi:hypothetical protein
LKLGDVRMLIELYVDMHMWDQAFKTGRNQQKYAASIYVPYAEIM